VPRLWALGDLHLSLSGAKPMDVFGEAWREHPKRMAEGWDARVAPEDVVLLPGDLSWARSLAEAAPDLAWIGARPGFKVLLRGNHDGWWSSLKKVRQALPPGCEALQNDSIRAGGRVVLGGRDQLRVAQPVGQHRRCAAVR
jgi:predicted phosphohydrolase